MIEKILSLFGYVKKSKVVNGVFNGTTTYKSRDLGKCITCDRPARWEGYRGNVCNTCSDYLCGLE